ncbi:MAG: N-acetyltransferase family protein [Actinomycetota bacterium]
MTTGPVTLRLATVADAAAMAAIYNHEVETHTSTFDLRPRSIDEQRRWIAERSGAFSAVVAELPVAVEERPQPSRRHNVGGGESTAAELVGFASLSPYKPRPAYSTTVENSVYVSRRHGGRGIGKALMTHIVDVARGSGFHTVIARVEASGTASRALHESCGFRLVGVEEEVGRKFGRWLSVAVYQLQL